MAAHLVDAEVIQLPIPSYCVEFCLGTNDGSTLWSIPDLEHSLTGIAENRFRTRMRMQLSLDIFKQGLDSAKYHCPSTVV